MHFRDVYSLDEAASRIGIAPRRLAQMLTRGEIAGERHGRGWLVAADSITATRVRPTPVGRPFGQRLSWAILAELEDRPHPRELAREERRRLNEHLQRPFGDLAPRLRGRAKRQPLIASPGAIGRAVVSSRWVIGGGRALPHLVARPGPPLDVYLRADAFDALLDETLAVPDPTYPNLVAHVVDVSEWPFGTTRAAASAWETASLLDCYEAGSLDAAALSAAVDRLTAHSGSAQAAGED